MSIYYQEKAVDDAVKALDKNVATSCHLCVGLVYLRQERDVPVSWAFSLLIIARFAQKRKCKRLTA